MNVSNTAKVLYFVICVVQLSAQNIPISENLVDRLSETTWINEEEIINQLELVKSDRKRDFDLANPYYPSTVLSIDNNNLSLDDTHHLEFEKVGLHDVKFYHQPAVHNWHHLASEEEKEETVCGCQFTNEEKNEYVLKTFKNEREMEKHSYFLTHQGHCGACSSLQDLAVFLKSNDMVKEGRKCGLVLNPKKKLACHKEIGLTDPCAQAWTYNAINTFKQCRKVCVKEYGLLNLILRKFPEEYVNEDGSLKPCLECDEIKSGPGYKYITGRTRRSSGIQSEIKRTNKELFVVDYARYYEEFKMMSVGVVDSNNENSPGLDRYVYWRDFMDLKVNVE